MNDDAKFLFFLSGFGGFIFFYFVSFLMNHDLVVALIKGSFGCLVGGLSCRLILGFALKHTKIVLSSTESKIGNDDQNFADIEQNVSIKNGGQPLDELAAQTNLEALNKKVIATPSLKLNR